MSDEIPLEIVLVDDSEDDRFLFAAAFRKSGLAGRIVEKEDGDQAIELLEQIASGAVTAPPAAVFLDLKMPARNGFEVLEWLQQKPALKDLRVYVLSGSYEPSDIKRARELGASDYIVKPIKPDQIRQLLEGL